MSLAVTTASSLTIIDGSFLKKETKHYEPRTIRLPVAPFAHIWSHDNATIYLASTNSIYSFTPSNDKLSIIYDSLKSPIQPILASCDKSSLIFAQGSSIHLLALGTSPPKITSTLIGHSTPITSLSLSYDGSLLASSSASGTLCVHNLAHNSLTVLKGLSISTKKAVCSFHPHIRTRLLVGFAKTLALYDVTRPSSPIKTVPLIEKNKAGDASLGHVVAISSSPFSKSLTAVALTSGCLILLDLEKDPSVIKSLHLKVPITSMSFTMDGIGIALGTEHGKVLLKEWRSAAGDQRTLAVGSQNGERILSLCIQRRIKGVSSPTKNVTTSLKVKPFSQQNLNCASPSFPASSAKARVIDSATPLKPIGTEQKTKKTFSPPKRSISDDETDISVQVDTLMDTTKLNHTTRKTSGHVTKRDTTSSNLRPSPFRVTSSSANSMSRVSSIHIDRTNRTSQEPQVKSKTRPSSRQTTISNQSDLNTNPELTTLKSSVLVEDGLQLLIPDRFSEVDSFSSRPTRMITKIDRILATPDIEHWSEIGQTQISSGESECPKHIPWAITDSRADSNQDLEDHDSNGKVAENNMSEISSSGASGPVTDTWIRSLLNDMLYDYRKEMREDIKGIHLDLLRIGRSWKTELKTLMEEYVGDMKGLVDENMRLRQENERLRRGF